MSKPVSYTVTAMQPESVYGTQMRVDAKDEKGQPAGSTYVDTEEQAAEWFACLQDAHADLGATPAHTEKDV
jgi:hypothetical protein